MDLIDFRNHVLAERLAEIKEKRNNNLTAILSVAGATISTTTNERKTENE
jgi:pheromone shutdown protein TraB